MFDIRIVIDTPESEEYEFDNVDAARAWVANEIDECKQRLEHLEELEQALEPTPALMVPVRPGHYQATLTDIESASTEELEAAASIAKANGI